MIGYLRYKFFPIANQKTRYYNCFESQTKFVCVAYDDFQTSVRAFDNVHESTKKKLDFPLKSHSFHALQGPRIFDKMRLWSRAYNPFSSFSKKVILK